jgi:hypothetical protein
MDLRLHFRVLWRFRILVALGILCALAVAFLALMRVDFATGKVSYRASEQWVSYSRIFVTQRGFPYGAVRTSGQDPASLAANAILYSQLANTDPVLHLAFGPTKPPGTIQAAPVLASQSGSDALPIISIAATAATSTKAKSLARRETSGLIRYVQSLQNGAQIASDNRVQLRVIQQPVLATLLKGRSKTLPIVVFLTTLLAFVGLAFVLENLRPLAGKEFAPVSLPRAENVA